MPLILYQPRLLAPRVVRAPARHVDLLPTILDALSLDPPAGIDGESLLAKAAGEAAGEEPAIYFEALSGQLNRGWAPLYGVIQEGWKYIDLPIPELYRLPDDPLEERNLASAEPRRLAELGEVLEALRATDRGSEPSPEAAEVRERLRSLGYLGGGAGPAPATYGEEDDPKRLIALDALQREVAGLYVAGDLAGALRRCRELVRRRPGMRVALLDLAHLERESGNLDAGVEALRRAFALNPEDPATLALLGAYLTQAGRVAEAVEVTRPHAELAVPDLDVLFVRSLALARLGRAAEALAALAKARATDAGNPMVAVHLGTVYLMQGERAKARLAYEEALALNPGAARAHSSLAIMALESGQIEEAVTHWSRAGTADPQEWGKLLVIGTRLWQAGRRAEARPLLELFVAAAPARTYREEIGRVRGLLGVPG